VFLVRKLKRSKILAVLMFCIFAASTMMLSGCGSDAEASRNWTLVNPEGATEVASLQLNEHPKSLEGKTVGLVWNSKENGDNLLNTIAEELEKTVKDVKVVKIYEEIPESQGYGPNIFTQEVIGKIQALKPDLVIAAQAD
jgi:ABC-type Fe3+-hydroxamate transport system substrate-binding protein